MQSRQSRNNPQIWRLAEYLWNRMPYFMPDTWPPHQEEKNKVYDFAAELLKKIESKDFVGQDQHGD